MSICKYRNAVKWVGIEFKSEINQSNYLGGGGGGGTEDFWNKISIISSWTLESLWNSIENPWNK